MSEHTETERAIQKARKAVTEAGKVLNDSAYKKKDIKRETITRALRPQTSGSQGKPFGEIIGGAAKSVRDFVAAPIQAFAEQQREIEEGRKPPQDNTIPQVSPLAGIVGKDPVEPTPEQELSDQVKTPKFFGDMNQSATGEITDTTPQSNIRVVGEGPFGKQEVNKIGRSDFELEAEKFQRDEAAAIAAFDDDNDGVLSDKERDNQRAFNRENLLTGFRERKERAEASLAATNARRAAAAAEEDQGLINEMGDELIAKDKVAAETAAAAAAANPDEQIQNRRKLFDRVKTLSEQGRLTTETYEKLKAREGGLVNLSPEEFDKTFKAAGIIPNDQSGGLRRKDFGSNAAFLAAVGRNQAAQPQGAQAAPMGSGSALRQAPRELGSLAGRLRRAARAARRDGATAEANKLFGAAAMQGLREPNILSEEQRGRIAAKQREAQSINESNRAFEKKLNEYASRVLDARIKGLETGGLRTGGLRTGGLRTGGLGIRKMGPVFRPDGPVTTTYDRGDGTRGTMTTRRRPDMGAGMNFVDFEGT